MERFIADQRMTHPEATPSKRATVGQDQGLLEVPGREERIHWASLAVLFFLTLLHVIATWGHIGIFWGDQGRWLGEVERFAHTGAYTWVFPPLALWLLGGIARLFGSGVNVIWTATSVIFALVLVAYFQYVSLLVRRPFIPGVLIGGFLLSTAYANWASGPLPTGMYVPAAPLGFLVVLIAVVLSLKLLGSPRRGYAIGLGLCAGLAILTKHDFWIPSFYLVTVSTGILLASRRRPAWSHAGWLWSVLCLTVATGTATVAAQSSWSSVARMPGGFGQVTEYLGRGFPSWERLVVEETALALLTLAVLVSLALGRVVPPAKLRTLTIVVIVAATAGASLHSTMTYRTALRLRVTPSGPLVPPGEQYLRALDGPGAPLPPLALAWLRQRLQDHLFPTLLPITLSLVIAARWRRLHPAPLRNTAAFLAGLCVAGRARRGFEHVEWHHILLETPCYLLAIQLLVPAARQRPAGLRVALSGLFLVGLYSYWSLGVGLFTQAGGFERVDTPKGAVYLRALDAANYRELSAALMRRDPTGTRPVLANAYSHAFNYFLGRPSPRPGWFSAGGPVNADPSHAPRPFLLDNAAFWNLAVPAPRINLTGWDLEMTESWYTRNRPFFLRMTSGCKQVGAIPNGEPLFVTIHDCGALPPSSRAAEEPRRFGG
jgi:hypothetical protein